MPNRMLRDWTDSEAVNKLSVGAERFFVRLIMKADDFGRYYADARLLRSFLYPRIIEKVKDSDVVKFLDECEKQGLIDVYEIEDKKYLQIKEFGQRLRSMKSKFPGPGDKNDGHLSDICPPTAADGRGPRTNVSPEEEARRGSRSEKREEEAGSKKGEVVSVETIPIAPRMVAIFKKSFPGYPVDVGKDYPSALQIAKKIADMNGWPAESVANGKQEDVALEWTALVSFAKNDKWYSKKSIPYINDKWQDFIQASKNNENGAKQGPQGAGKYNRGGVVNGIDVSEIDRTGFGEL